MMAPAELSRLIKLFSSELGFNHCGIARAEKLNDHKSRLKDWLDSGFNGTMGYMERNFELRTNPTLLVEGALSIISVSLNYYSKDRSGDNHAMFSKYAYGRDYHLIIKDKLYLLLEYIKTQSPELKGRVFVDSAPLLERAWDKRSGLGWIGKNSLLLNRETGSYSFLGFLIVDKELEYDDPFSDDYCGSCSLCIDSCPTSAINNDRSLDSRKCISYLSIEKKGDFDPLDKVSLNGWVFGCDICQDVCPWNRKLRETQEEGFTILPEIAEKSTEDWKLITEDEFNSIFRNSPVLRTGYKSFLRNLDHL